MLDYTPGSEIKGYTQMSPLGSVHRMMQEIRLIGHHLLAMQMPTLDFGHYCNLYHQWYVQVEEHKRRNRLEE
jgi:hypothetical protein